MRFPVTVCGLTIELPREHRFGFDRKRRRQWYFRAHLPEMYAAFDAHDRCQRSGMSFRILVTEEEEREIQIAELLRRRGEEERTMKYTTEKLRIIEKRLQELGYDSQADHNSPSL